MKKMWEKVLLFVWLWCIIILSFIILTVRRIFMINFLNTAAQMVAAKSTISPDQKDLGAGTVASVVITGIVVVFIGLVLLILLVRLLLLVLILIAVLVLVFAVLHGAHLLSVPFVLRLVWPRAC